MSTSGGKFIDEMRYLEALAQTVKEEVARDRSKREKAAKIMQKDLHSLYISTEGLAHIGAKIPLGPKHLRRLLKMVRRLVSLKSYLTPDEWLVRYEKFKIELSGLVFVADREPSTPQLIPKMPYQQGDGRGSPRRDRGRLDFITRRIRKERQQSEQ